MDKISLLKKLAMGAAAGTAMLTAEEAQGAGLETIARKLGIGLEDAAKVKQLAISKVPESVFDENLKAIQTVAKYKKDPAAFPKIGHGMDYRALDVGNDKVLKVPKDLTEDSDMFRVAPGLMEQAGLGPKTKTINAGDKSYMLQDKVTPLDAIMKKSSRPGGDPELEALYKQSDKMWKNVDINDEKAVNAFAHSPEILELQSQIDNRQNQIRKNQGFDVDKLVEDYRSLPDHQKSWVAADESKIKENPEEGFESMMYNRANQKLGNVINPIDLHSGNIGFDAKGNPTAFDTSRFEGFKPEKLSDEQRQAIMDANIALPEKKAALQRLLDSGNMQKVAAVGAMPTVDNDLIRKPLHDLGEAYSSIRRPITDATTKAGEWIADTVRPPVDLPEDAKQRERNIAGGITSMALDPANLLGPGAGLAVGAADLSAPEAQPLDYDKLRKLMGK